MTVSSTSRGGDVDDSRRCSADVIILLPVYDDWRALALLLVDVDAVLRKENVTAAGVVVDDGSTEAPPAALPPLTHVASVEVVRLRRNLGHQRAIAVGLAHVSASPVPEAIVVMDSDGEDRPADIPRLIARLREGGGRRSVFAERTKRFEPYWFRWLYALYRHLHLLLTGIPVRVGNFSAIPGAALPSVVSLSELWSHYAAAVFKARLPRDSVPTVRGTRLSGEGKMDFFGLVNHGLTALAVFAEAVGIRVLIAASSAVVLSVLLLLVAMALSPVARLTWSTFVAGLLVVCSVQVMLVAGATLFLVLYMRDRYSFIPTRDHHVFIERVWTMRMEAPATAAGTP